MQFRERAGGKGLTIALTEKVGHPHNTTTYGKRPTGSGTLRKKMHGRELVAKDSFTLAAKSTQERIIRCTPCSIARILRDVVVCNV